MAESEEQDLERLWSLCRALLGANVSQELVVQIVRVLLRITSPEEREEIDNQSAIVRAFKTKRLIPEALVALCNGHNVGGLTGEALAVCFAACAYPQRAFQMPELDQRLSAFLGVLPHLFMRAAQDVVATVLGNLVQSLDEKEINDLFTDLSAAKCVLGPAPQSETLEKERRTGAALYLASCHAALVGRICKNWHLDGGFVRYLVGNRLATPPSRLTDPPRDSSEQPLWTHVRTQWALESPAPSPEHDERVVTLEQSVWGEAQLWRASRLADAVDTFWEAYWNLLTSGFPYYAFHSSFRTWWRQCLAHYSFSTMFLQPQAEGGGEASDPFGLTPERLRYFREGYRLVRATFFPHSETQRAALDALWSYRLERYMMDEDGNLQPEACSEIARRFGLCQSTIYNLSNSLRLRIWAYTLARIHEFTNAEIRSARRPVGARRSAPDYPLAKEDGVLTVASLARMIPLHNSLLWAFIAHVSLHPKVDPQHSDLWTLERLVGELWWWVREEQFDEAVRRGAARGNRADQMARQEILFRLQELQALQTEQDLNHYLQNLQLDQEAQILREKVGRLIGDPALDTCDEAFLRAALAEVSRRYHYLIVPVWYLTRVEQLETRLLVPRLRADADEEQVVLTLAKRYMP
jgi:hypothetical protein